ncbi:MAG: tRNA lysidine(34) synthetase TilS, partial [Phycisphaeraceae bacterium]|nr:tRNA lysidine(34) synthetase TilS [Phycisphaeraceae bacterium]
MDQTRHSIDADLGSFHPLVRTVAGALRRHVLNKRQGGSSRRLLVAVSGGADSVALLRAMLTLAGRRGWEMDLAVGHVQHHLRHQAEDDARFVAELADKHGLAYLRADLDMTDAGGANLEAVGRQKRYEALGVMVQSLGATHVLTAHQADDQLETLLMRLLRGASARGWSGMAWRRRLSPGSDVSLVRPMLAVSRDDVLDYLRAIGQTWREDHTNADVTRWRARLRRDVLPVLRDLRPDAAERAVA